MEVCTKLATAGAPHKILVKLAGSWITKGRVWMEPDKPPWKAQAPASRKCSLTEFTCNRSTRAR